MKRFIRIVWVLSVVFSFVACGDMLRSLRQESLEADQSAAADGDSERDTAVAAKPKRYNGLSANNSNSYDPPVRRNYGGRGLASLDVDKEAPVAAASKRYTRDDFKDKNPSENSLWDSQGQSNYLFANNRKREVGDAITVDVERELKREIQYALWQTLPPEQRKVRKLASMSDSADPNNSSAKKDLKNPAKAMADAGKSALEKGKDAAEEAAKTNIQSGGKEDDIVRMEVAESVGNGMVRLVGTKRVIYRGVAKSVEVVALVNSKDIDDNNHLKSGTFLDMQTQVVE